MAKKMYIGVGGDNIFSSVANAGKSNIGVTYSYDTATGDYTLNGISTSTGDLLLESNVPLSWVTGERYTVTITQTGGLAIMGEGSGITYSFSIFSMDNTKYMRNGNLSVERFPGQLSFTGSAIAESGGTGFKFYLQLWRPGTIFKDYKFKVEIRKEGIAREVKKIYVGVENIARKVKKGFIGVAGIARQFFGEPELVYYGTTTALSNAREELAATTIGDYALFAGGLYNDSTLRNTVDTYNKSLVKGTATNLSTKRYGLKATTVGDYALFAGGLVGSFNDWSYSDAVDSYTSNLTKGTPTALSTARSNFAATTVGNYALFAGGNIDASDSTGYTGSVETYDSNLVKGTASSLGGVAEHTATTVGEYALFGGGSYSTYQKKVFAYNSNLVKNSTAGDLSTARHRFTATSIGDYAIFGGGKGTTTVDTVDIYTSNLVKGTATNLSTERYDLASTSTENYAIFGSGSNGLTNYDAYNKDLVKAEIGLPTTQRILPAATTIGDYALFGGGRYTSDLSSVDVYQEIS